MPKALSLEKEVNMYQEIKELTKKLVSIPSVNTTNGEKEIGLYIEQYIRNIEYFKMNPNNVIIQKLKNDELERRNVFALLKGGNGQYKKTIIFHGHTDTVGVEDFGALKEFAFDSDELARQFQEINLSKEVQEDLNSGEYLFGRGALDMKSGDAVFLVILKKLSEVVDELKGNILVTFNPVEENLHTGIIEGLNILDQLKNEQNLKYILAINNDFICPMYQGDKTKYIYTGSVGKLLPSFYIQGKETHVGQCFEGFDASMVAANLINILNLNSDFCDEFKGEVTLPPSVLKMKDLKTWYNVQTSKEAFVYFNYFIHNDSVENIIEKLKTKALTALEKVNATINHEYKKYCELSGNTYTTIEYNLQSIDYAELCERAKKVYNGNLDNYINELGKKYEEEEVDKREIGLLIIKELMNIVNITDPTIVLYFAPPYCPHNTLQGEEEKIIKNIENILGKMKETCDEEYRICRFFPSLTDSSYLKVDDSDSSIEELISNFPVYNQIYPVPLKKIKRLNIPAINYGCHGKDAHKWTERVHMPYSFEILPKLIMKTVNYYLG